MRRTDAEKKNVLLAPVGNHRAPEAIYEQLRGMIVSGELRPGDRLPSERRMMEMLQRSRPTIREALRMLERAGLIKTIPGSGGAVVREPDAVSVEHPLENMVALGGISKAELLEYRRLNDVTFAEWAAQRRNGEDIARMAENLERMAETLDDSDGFIVCDVQFHRLIAEAGKNGFAVIVSGVIAKVVSDMLHAEFAKLSVDRGRELRKSVFELHRQIFEAIKASDGNTARKAAEEHMLGFENDFED